MADDRILQVLDAIAVRLAAISGIGDSGLTPKPPENITGFPAAFVTACRADQNERTLGGAGGSQTCLLRVTVTGVTKGVACFRPVVELAADIIRAVEADPVNLALTTAAGAHRVVWESVDTPPIVHPQAADYAVAIVVFRVTVNRPFGAA